jgi:hypothetical protein
MAGWMPHCPRALWSPGAHPIRAQAFAVEQLCVPLAGGRIGQWLKNRLAQRGQQGGGGLVDLVAVGL